MEERSRVQNIWLILLAGMTVLFWLLMLVVRSHTGVLFHDALLEVQGSPENAVYTGKAHGETVSITVGRESETETTLELVIGGLVHENWLVEYPLEPIATEHGWEIPGLRISRNSETVFEGAYDPDHRQDWGYMLYDTNGEWYAGEILSVTVSAGTVSSYWDDYETSVNTVLKFVNGPEITARGSWQLWFYGLLFSAMAAVLVAFPNALFRWNHRWHVKDPEPTEFYYFSNRIGSGIVTIMALVTYIIGVCTIP